MLYYEVFTLTTGLCCVMRLCSSAADTPLVAQCHIMVKWVLYALCKSAVKKVLVVLSVSRGKQALVEVCSSMVSVALYDA